LRSFRTKITFRKGVLSVSKPEGGGKRKPKDNEGKVKSLKRLKKGWTCISKKPSCGRIEWQLGKNTKNS